MNFNPRSSAHPTVPQYFNPRSPCGERHSARTRLIGLILFQSTLPLRGATRPPVNFVRRGEISIHAPPAGSDHNNTTTQHNQTHFNPRSPCGERLGNIETHGAKSHISIHAPPAGSDPERTTPMTRCINFNPRSPCGERRAVQHRAGRCLDISIHAPPAGSDRSLMLPFSEFSIFQSTLPLRGATNDLLRDLQYDQISIHAPPAGSDPVGAPKLYCSLFQSTLPLRGATNGWTPVNDSAKFQSTLPLRGATWLEPSHAPSQSQFQSTLPLRGATTMYWRITTTLLISIHAPPAGSDVPYAGVIPESIPISIHAPPAGSDWMIWPRNSTNSNFNPRSPCGERRIDKQRIYSRVLISIHAPPAGSDRLLMGMFRSSFNFNPRSPCGERPDIIMSLLILLVFQSTLPLRGATTLINDIAVLRQISIHAPPAGSD